LRRFFIMTPVHAMVVTPHPDDAEFGVAGTVARWTREDKQVVYVVCTSGEKGSNDPDMKPEVLAGIREEEQKAAARVLGVKEVVFLGYPDQGLEDTSEFRKNLVRMIRKYRPEIVVTADPYRRYIWHRDHRITGRVTMDAVFPYARDRLAYPDLLEEGFQPHKVKEVWFWGAEDVNFRSDITDTIDVKIAALLCHESQTSQFNSIDWAKWIKERNKAMAGEENYEFTEAFHRAEIMY
jgi:LmbE family N-acetylglucosaminyl deacetylase